MRLVGDEKRIQALFRELRREDQQVVPGFESVWGYAPAARSELRQARSSSLVALVSLLVIATVTSFVIWSTDRSLEIPKQEVAGMIPPVNPISVNSLETSIQQKRPPRKKTHPAAKSIIRDAIAFSMWKSPTANLMGSPAGSEINSLPQLNQAAKELQLFLPDNR